MKRIAIFGKPGGGKSTLAEQLSKTLELPLYALDLIEYKKNGEKVSIEEYEKSHNKIINGDKWVIEGFGYRQSFWSRLESTDTLIYVDLPYKTHYCLVIKRFLKGAYSKPKGWPPGSSVVKGTINSFKFLKLSPLFWNQEFINKLQGQYPHKKLIWLKSKERLMNVVNEIQNENI